MAELLKNIFLRPVDRAIEGVIKADDEAALKNELEEYVLTNEIERQLERFLDAYKNYETANGVWISGFFGSGKSHLLKMLALLLENREIDGTRAYDIFKPKCLENEILKSDLARAVEIPSRSILFNIDQKADVISKTQVDALLAVFQKVFDEMCGYYGKQPHIAQFERDLESRGILAKFREAYAGLAGKAWNRGREQSILEGANIARAYAAATGQPEAEGQGILDRYRRDYRSSIEDFAQRVNDYITAQGPKFRLNFFVDEVGQYIADNVKLMTNLQTIAESLNTKCRGRAWIIVTAQQDMGAVIGDMTQKQENDFSKIQARFANRIPLNSADVAEVIQERLLKKKADGIATLSDLHHQQAGNLKTLFDFTDGSIRLENFRDRDHFVKSYPFVPYQYTLFQMAIQNLSQHNAFEGKHSSVGERSMLGVFQDVVIRLADMPLGHIATFDQMFEGIRTALKSNVQQSILIAERNLGDVFATRVLKALFLVKYVKPFKATVRNIAILLQEQFDIDQTKHRRAIEEALELLWQNTYIQRSGELFEFLTDEEKDVEQEIKSVLVDSAEIARELQSLIFISVIKCRKIKHEKSSQEFAFAERLDDRLMGRDYELSINVVTPFHDDRAESAVRMRTVASDQLAVLLSADSRFVSDLYTYKRTDKYVRQTRATAPQPSIERIIRDKGEKNGDLQRDLVTKMRTLLGEAKLFVRGEEIEVRTEDAQARVEKAFQSLIDKVYTNLPMLRSETYAEADIGKFFKQGKTTLAGLGEVALTEPEQEIINFAQNNARLGVRTTVKAITEKFEIKNYGWSYHAILAMVAGLFGRGKLEATADGAALEGDALERALRNAHQLANIVLELQVEFTPGQIKKLKEFFNEFFDAAPGNSDGKSLGVETGAALAKARDEIAQLITQTKTYPFLAALEPLATAMGQLIGKPYGWYLTDLPKQADALLDAKEAVLGPIKRFMGGPQKALYDEAGAYLMRQAENFTYAGAARAETIRSVLADPTCFKGGVIQKLKGELDALQAEISKALAAERAEGETQIASYRANLHALQEWPQVPTAEQFAIDAEFDAGLQPLRSTDLIGIVRGRLADFKASVYPRLLERAVRSATPPAPKPVPPAPKPATGMEEGPAAPFAPTPAPAPKTTEFVPVGALPVKYAKPFLADESDVGAYLESLRETLLKAIRDGKRITL
jgi:energy-coupling factor transporter ATP-binding protein EcfA2